MTRLNKDTCWRQLTFFCKICFTHKATRNSEHFKSSFSIHRIKHDISLTSPNPEGHHETNTIWNCCHALLPFVSFKKYSHHQWLDSKHFEQNWEIRFHRHQGEAPSSTHVIQCRIRVRPRYLTKWVRPTWPGQNVTRLTQMIRPGFNPASSYKVVVEAFPCEFLIVFWSVKWKWGEFHSFYTVQTAQVDFDYAVCASRHTVWLCWHYAWSLQCTY